MALLKGKQIEVLAATNNEWAILCTSMVGNFDNYYPSSPWMQFVMRNPIIFSKITRKEPITGAMNIFTDGSKGGVVVVYVEGKELNIHLFPCQSAQVVELNAVLQVFLEYPNPFNLISDSQYVVQAVQQLETVGLIKHTSTVPELLSTLQRCNWERKHPFSIIHIRAHTGLSGPIAEGNSIADANTCVVFAFVAASALQ